MSMAAQSMRWSAWMLANGSDPPSRPDSATGLLDGMGGILELPEEAGDDEGDLLADVHGVVGDALDRPRGEEHRHRPFADVGVVAELQGEPEAVTVEVVDDIVLTDQVPGHLDIALFEGPLRLSDQGPCLATHHQDQPDHPLVSRRLVAGQWNHL